jgi:signal transduction histidine kinase
MDKITDSELLAELDKRFKSNEQTLEQQKNLLAELELVNKRLLSAEQVKSQFLSNIRNEIVNPLTSILGLSKNLKKNYNNEDAITKTSTLIYQEAFDLDFQLSNIFVAAELEAGELVPEIANANINEVVKQVADQLQHKAKKKGITITIINKLSDPTFRTDAGKIHLIISNLLANAIEFSNDGGAVNLSLQTKNNELMIAIQDFGIGIDLDHQTVIYDRFKQLEAGSTKGHGGHGLGLSIVKDLLELLGGKIGLESEVKRGSTFTIFLTEGDEHEDLNLTLGGNEFLFDEIDELF